MSRRRIIRSVCNFRCFFDRFYICCDRCQDWFHGRCVGILQSEADNIDEYTCPNCLNSSAVNHANMKNLSTKDYEALRKLYKQLQVRSQEIRNLVWKVWEYLAYDRFAKTVWERLCFSDTCACVWSSFPCFRLQSHKSAWPFIEPVDPTEAPDYYKVIKEPMGKSLSCLKEQLQTTSVGKLKVVESAVICLLSGEVM